MGDVAVVEVDGAGAGAGVEVDDSVDPTVAAEVDEFAENAPNEMFDLTLGF